MDRITLRDGVVFVLACAAVSLCATGLMLFFLA